MLVDYVKPCIIRNKRPLLSFICLFDKQILLTVVCSRIPLDNLIFWTYTFPCIDTLLILLWFVFPAEPTAMDLPLYPVFPLDILFLM